MNTTHAPDDICECGHTHTKPSWLDPTILCCGVYGCDCPGFLPLFSDDEKTVMGAVPGFVPHAVVTLTPPPTPAILGDGALWTCVAVLGPWSGVARRYHAPAAVAGALEELGAAVRAAFPVKHGWAAPPRPRRCTGCHGPLMRGRTAEVRSGATVVAVDAQGREFVYACTCAAAEPPRWETLRHEQWEAVPAEETPR